VEPLLAALKHEDSHTRWAAARALGWIDDPRAVKALATEAEKAARLKAMEEQGRRLLVGGPGPDFDAAFAGLFADLENDDPGIRLGASRILADHAPRKVASVYEECLYSDPRRAGLAGRVLGRKAAKGPFDMIPVQVAQMLYGVSASFLPCPCAHCGHQNGGIAAPPNGPMVGYYGQRDAIGAYAVSVLCDKCGKDFFVVWDTDPR